MRSHGSRSAIADNRDAKRRRVAQLTVLLGAGATVGAGALSVALADTASKAVVANALAAKSGSTAKVGKPIPSSLRATKRPAERHRAKKAQNHHAPKAVTTTNASTPKPKATATTTTVIYPPPAQASGGGSGTSSGGSHP